jgi:hypothetical protein
MCPFKKKKVVYRKLLKNIILGAPKFAEQLNQIMSIHVRKKAVVDFQDTLKLIPLSTGL